MAARYRRGYSTEFQARGKGKAMFIDGIPSTFWSRVKAKAAREGYSIRGIVLTLLRDWLEETHAAGNRGADADLRGGREATPDAREDGAAESSEWRAGVREAGTEDVAVQAGVDQ